MMVVLLVCGCLRGDDVVDTDSCPWPGEVIIEGIDIESSFGGFVVEKLRIDGILWPFPYERGVDIKIVESGRIHVDVATAHGA
jgi:hypothetical protein